MASYAADNPEFPLLDPGLSVGMTPHPPIPIVERAPLGACEVWLGVSVKYFAAGPDVDVEVLESSESFEIGKEELDAVASQIRYRLRSEKSGLRNGWFIYKSKKSQLPPTDESEPNKALNTDASAAGAG